MSMRITGTNMSPAIDNNDSVYVTQFIDGRVATKDVTMHVSGGGIVQFNSSPIYVRTQFAPLGYYCVCRVETGTDYTERYASIVCDFLGDEDS